MNCGNCGICGKQITSKQVMELYKGKTICHQKCHSALQGDQSNLEHLKF